MKKICQNFLACFVAMAVVCLVAMALCFCPCLFKHRLVGQVVLPGFKPERVSSIESNGKTFLAKVDGQWQVVPLGGYPAHDVMPMLYEVANMKVCSVARDQESLDMAKLGHQRVVFRDEKGLSLGEINLMGFHYEIHRGFVESLAFVDGRFLELSNEVVVVKEAVEGLSKSDIGWAKRPNLMSPISMTYARDVMVYMVSIEYSFNGNRFEVKRDVSGSLHWKGIDDDDIPFEPKAADLVHIQDVFDIKPAKEFLKTSIRYTKENGVLKVCTTDGKETFSRSALLYRGQDGTGYVVVGDWVYVIGYWYSKKYFVSHDDLLKRKDCRKRGMPW